MNSARKHGNGVAYRLLTIALCAAIATCSTVLYSASISGQQAPQDNAPGAVARRVGTIKAINGATITLAPAPNLIVDVTVVTVTRIGRVEPGETNPKNATPLQLQDLQVGDLIRVFGKVSDDGKSIVASSIIALKASDVEARNRQTLQDWQKRGVDGVATAVNPAAGTVTISVRSKDVVVHAGTHTIVRRYSPDSVKFDDAKPSTLAEIHSGDQVRARGDRSADGTELTAEEIVSGTFRNIAGTVSSVDASSSTLNVHDLLSRKTVTVKIAQDSQLHQLPPEMAERFATRLKRAAAGAVPGAPSGDSSSGAQTGHSGANAGTPAAGGGMGSRPGGAPDLQQMLNRLPSVSLTDLHKDDAVIILATEGTAGVGTTITLLTGVEPILRAAPNASGASILTPWSLSAPSGDAGGP